MSESPNDANLDLSRMYATRDGRAVSVLTVKHVEQKARLLLGHVEGFGPCSWTLAGMYYSDNKSMHDLDLIPAAQKD